VSEQVPDASAYDRATRQIAILAIRVGCLAILCYWSLYIIWPFLAIIVWSVILTVALYPTFEWLAARLHYRPAAAALITIVILLIIIGPATKLGYSLVEYIHTKLDAFNKGEPLVSPLPDWLRNLPLIGAQLSDYWNTATGNFRETLTEWGPQLKPAAVSLLGVAGHIALGLVNFIIATIIAGFLFVPGPALVEVAKHVLRLVATDRGEEFLVLAGATIRNVSRGVIGIAVLQALLAGICMLVAHVPAAGLLSFLVLFFGVIQVGAWIVLVPLIIWSWFGLSDHTYAVLFILYMVPVALLDNILRPFVMARGLTTPMPVILIGVIGGTLAHGILGLFIGPVVLSIAWQLLMVWWSDGKAEIGQAEPPPLLE
jgi:predicted PurR-regulated permease PerM